MITQKKNIIIKVFLLSIILSGCVGKKPPNIAGITYSNGIIKITLEDENEVDKEKVKAGITLTEGGFTGNKINFTISTVSSNSNWVSSEYELKEFEPPIKNGIKYYLYFKEGTFGNSGTWEYIDDEETISDAGAFVFTG